MTAIRPLVAGNWKMNGLGSGLRELVALRDHLTEAPVPEADVMVCPPATLLSRAADMLAGTPITLGAQDCHPEASGTHTGDISAEMLADAGATAIIVGHSERRIDHSETNELVNAKALAAYRAGLTAIICIGETEAQHRDGEILDALKTQVQGSVPGEAYPSNTVIAYEPVWAIGSGLTPTPEDVARLHTAIREDLCSVLGADAGGAVRILYGGSVKPGNAAELMTVPNVNGALVGGASLQASDFYEIIAVYRGTAAT
ncbi:MAG: triose-phosphate isomerase [Alphaproteobacteria bacterium]